MPKNHIGAVSGDVYTIPELTDQRDIEVAFQDFADTLPKGSKPFITERVTANHQAVPSRLYIGDSATPITITLPAAPHLNGDSVKVIQTGAGVVTFSAGSEAVQGPLATTGQFTALTAIWVADEARWVVVPFFFSGTRPGSSTGGTKPPVDVNGSRYHVYDVAGDFTFYPHKDMTVTVWLIGMGGEGALSGTQPGQGGRGSIPVSGTLAAEGMLSIPVHVGGPVGNDSRAGALTALAGADAVVDTVLPDDPTTTLTGDLATVMTSLGHLAAVGGSGLDDGGPVVPSRFGQGGAGAHRLLATITRPSHVQVINHPGTPGSDGYWVDQSYPAERYMSDFWGEYIHGDTMACPGGTQACGNGQCCVNGTNCHSCVGPGACPDGWWIAPGGGHCMTYVQHPIYSYRCPNGGDLQGTTCVKGYQVPGTPGTPGWSENVTVWDPCPSGYKVGPDTTKCVDARSGGRGEPGDGCVVISYPHP